MHLARETLDTTHPGVTIHLIVCAMAVLLVWPAQSWAYAPQPGASAAVIAEAPSLQGAAGDHAQALMAARGTTLALSPGRLFKQLARALSRPIRGTPGRSGQPRGGKANHDRIHTERYGEGSISGRERDWGTLTPEERAFARDLAERGFDVAIIPTRRDRQTPDFSVNGTTIELKTLQAFGKNTVRNNLKKAMDQNPVSSSSTAGTSRPSSSLCSDRYEMQRQL